MTLNKQKMVREIGRRTRLSNREVQEFLETLIDVWTEELVTGGRIELQNFLVLETLKIDRGNDHNELENSVIPQHIKRITLRASKRLRKKINDSQSN